MPAPSTRPGLGSMPYPGGVTFRVWAPFAPWVRVAGTFNHWSATANDLASEGNGNWSADVPGAAVGHEYRFILGNLNRWRADPRALDVTDDEHRPANAVVTQSMYAWKINDFGMPPWNELVIYEMHAASFPDDPVARGDLFKAIANDLDYLGKLGVNVIELMPAQEFPGDQSWGYNPAHIFAIEDSYGGPDALKEFVDEAHRNGIAVLLDVVYRNFGPGLDQSLWQFDGWFDKWQGQDMGGIYFYNDWRADTEVGSRPDYGRPEVRQFIRDNALMWLEEYRIDGLRFDMVAGIRNARGLDNMPPDDPTNLGGWGWNLLKWVNDEVDYRQPWKPTIAEDMRQNAAVTRPTPQGGLGFDAQWDDQFHFALRRAMVTPRDEDRNMDEVRGAIERRFDGDAFKRVIYTESHDEVGDVGARPEGGLRVPEDIHRGSADSWFARKRSTLGAAVVFTSPGIPMIFQGQEMLEWIQFTGNSRMDWNKVQKFKGIVDLYRDLIHLRRNWFNNTRGLRGHNVNVFHVNPTDKVIAIHRWQDGGPGDDVVVVLNFANRGYPSYSIGFPRPGMWCVRFNSDSTHYSPDYGNHQSYDTTANWGEQDRMPCHANVGIGPYTAIILSQ